MGSLVLSKRGDNNMYAWLIKLDCELVVNQFSENCCETGLTWEHLVFRYDSDMVSEYMIVMTGEMGLS